MTNSPKQKRLRRISLRECFLVFFILGLLGLGVGLYFYFMPYPWELRQAAKKSIEYKATWPISKQDYSAALRLVNSQLKIYEFVVSVEFSSPTEVIFITIRRWYGPKNADHRVFTLTKTAGAWSIGKIGIMVN